MKKIKTIPSSYTMITTLVYALLGILFLQLYDASGIERENSVVNEEDTTKTIYSQQTIETQCESPCPLSVGMCIAMCA